MEIEARETVVRLHAQQVPTWLAKRGGCLRHALIVHLRLGYTEVDVARRLVRRPDHPTSGSRVLDPGRQLQRLPHLGPYRTRDLAGSPDRDRPVSGEAKLGRKVS